jgi:RimJ/RimL family protein N-acetyltransferase
MAGFPKFTNRLNIKPLSDNDIELREIVGWLNNIEVVRFSEQRHRRHNLGTQRDYFRSINTHSDHYLGIYTAIGSALIGTMTAIVDKNNMVANVGIMIGDRGAWGHGYGLEAWTGVCNELFHMGVRKVEAGCMAVNYRMMAICQRFDMVEEGRQDHHFLLEGEPVDLINWGKFNEAV